MLIGCILAGILTLSGTGLLYLSWTGKSPVSPVLTSLSGWVLLAASFWPWMWSNGVEFAWALLLFVPACGAWVWVLWHNREATPVNSTIVSHSTAGHPNIVTQSWLPSLRRVGDSLVRLLIYIPFCGIMSTWFTLALAKKLFIQDLDQGAFVVILTPLLWGILVGWLLMTDRLWRTASVIGVVGTLSALLLYFTAW